MKPSSSASQNSLNSISRDRDDTLVNSSDTETLTGSPEKCNENDELSDNQSLLEYEESDVDEANHLADKRKKNSVIQTQIDHMFENSSSNIKTDQLSSKDTGKVTRKVTVASQFDFEAMKGSDVVFPPKGLTRKIAPKDDWLKKNQKIMQNTNSVMSSSSAETLNEFESRDCRSDSVEKATNSDIHSSDECFTDNETVENSSGSSSQSSSVIDEFDDYDEWNDTCESVKKNLEHVILKDPSGTENNPVENSGKLVGMYLIFF